MIKLIPAKCPNCGADLQFPEGMEIGHCIHCGGKVIIDKNEPAPTHYHQDTHYYYDSKNVSFEQLDYNINLLEQEILQLRDVYIEKEESVNLLKKGHDVLVEEQKSWIKWCLLGAIISFILMGYNTICCSSLGIILIIIGIWTYGHASAPDEWKRYRDAKEELDELAKEILDEINKKRAEIEEIKQRKRDWR